MIRGTGNFEYANAIVRGQIGNLLTTNDYRAVLGCRKPSDLFQVLSRTPYRDLLARSKPSFTGVDEEVALAVSESATKFIAASPESSKSVLEQYRLLLESQSIVNLLKSKVTRGNVTATKTAIPLGAIPSRYYKLSEAPEEQFASQLIDPELGLIVLESLQMARKYECTAPLLRIVTCSSRRFLERNVETSFERWASMDRLVTSIIDGANIEMVLTGLECRLTPQTIFSWLLIQKGTITEESFKAALGLKDAEQLAAWLRNSRYRFCLEAKSGETTEDLLRKLTYCIMLQASRSVLAGYPFRVSTVAAAIVLKLLEVRSLRLAIAGASGELKRAAAFKLMVAP